MKVLFVCTGNICRSPLAAALMQRLAAERGRGDVEVSSAGTGAYNGGPASEGAYLIALEHGVDLSDHSASQLTREAVEQADVIFGMSRHHVERAVSLGGDGKTHLLGEYAGKAGAEAEVPDPFGGDLEDYRVTYEQLSELLPAALERLLADGG